MRGKRGKEKFLKRSPLSSLEFLFFLTPRFSVTERHNKSQGSVVQKQNRAVPPWLWNNGGDPILSALSLGFILALNAQMLLPFLWEKRLWTPPSHFPFLGHFHFIKLQSMCFVCGEEGLTHTVVVSVAVYIGGSSSPRIRPLCAVKR